MKNSEINNITEDAIKPQQMAHYLKHTEDALNKKTLKIPPPLPENAGEG